MKIKLTLLSGAMLMALFFTGCWDYPETSDLVTEQLVSFSSYDPTANFKDNSIVYVPDYIVKVNSDGTSQNIYANQNDNVKKVLDEIKVQLQNAKFTIGTSQATSNQTMNIAWSDINYVQIAYPTWWWDYWDYWDWYYPYPPYYPYPVVVGSYDVGVLVMEMGSNSEDASGKHPIYWMGGVRGIADIFVRPDSEYKSAIDDCFTQTKAFPIQ